jgi:acetyl esterase/lipase
MQKNILGIILTGFMVFAGCSKNTTEETAPIPDTGLYVSAQYTDGQLRVSRDIIYSTRPNLRNNQYTSNLTETAEMASNTLQMKMDIAVPPNASAGNKQPLIVFIHGGGFITGDKTDMTEQALSYARAGYVVASINYRLTKNQTNDTMRLISRIHALEDAGNAVRFLKANFQTYFIDTTRVLTLGSSAGGGLSLVNAIEADAATSISDFPGYSTRVNGAIATGATLRLDDITGFTLTYNAGDSPVLMFHANPLDGGTGATWQDVLDTQQRINASGNSCTVYPQPNLTHTVWLELGGPYWGPLKPFIWEKLRLAEKR